MTDVAKWEKQLERLLADSASDPPKIAAAIEKILSTSPRHIFALRCKVACLLHQDKHAAALMVLDQLVAAQPALRDTSQEYAFHKAYSLYRTQEYNQAQLVLQHAPHTAEHVPSQHLLAQLHYHMEEYEAAARIYESLLATGKFRDEQEKTELITNYTAACAANNVERTQSLVHAADEKTADLLFNAATAQLEAQDYAAALQTLQQAEVLCAQAHPASSVRSFQDALEKGDVALRALLQVKSSSERSFFKDVAAIWVQMAFVYYATHHEDKAMALLDVVLRYRLSSAATLAVASINWAAIRQHRDFFDTHRKLKSAQNPAVSSRLTSRQRLLVRYNTALLLMHTGNLDGFKRQVEIIANEYPNSDLTHFLKLALAVRENKKKRHSDDKTVLEYLKSYQQSMGGAQQQQKQQRSVAAGKLVPLIAAQIFLENGDLEHAIESLSSAPEDVRQKPCTLLMLATWKVQVGDVMGAKQLLHEFASAVSKDTTVVKKILFWAVHFLTTKGLYNDAVDVIRSMQRSLTVLQQDTEVRAILALCLSQYDMKEARASMEMIPESGFHSSLAAKKLSNSLIVQLESQKPSRQLIEALGYRRVAGDDGEENNAESGVKVKRVQQRRRRPMRRPPKNTETRIDPERWIPIAHRSYIKDLPERRKRELKRLRAIEQEQKRREAERKKVVAEQ